MFVGPGAVIGAILFVLALSWTTYAIYLPQLAKAAGIPALFVPWILALDQLIFALADWASGVYADRTLATMRRLVPTLIALTLISTIAFALLPLIGPALGADGFFFLTLTWVITTAALRAPPMAMLGSYVPPASRQWLASISTLALALGAALAPFLAKSIRDLDPRWPFIAAALAVMGAALCLYYVERTLPKVAAPPPVSQLRPWLPPLPAFVALALLLALGFQAQVLMLPSQLLRSVPKEFIESYLPLFWGAFAIGGAIAVMVLKHVDVRVAMIVGGVAAAAGASLGATATTASIVASAHVVAGTAWGVLLAGLFMIAFTHGSAGRAIGVVFAALALTACARIALTAVGWTGSPMVGERLAWLPSIAWLAGALLVAFTASRTLENQAGGRATTR